MTPLVSILIPAYNAEEWIADTIESALAQTWPRTEIIVVDDGSVDGTLAVARRYEARHVRVLSQTNQGGAAARNTAFSHSQGEYIQWLDADDLLAPDKISRQMAVARECGDPQVLVSGPWAHFMYRPHRAVFAPTPLWTDLSPVEWIIRKWTHNLHMQTATWLVSRELTTAVGPWNTALQVDDDGEYFTRTIVASHGVRFAKDAPVLYRVVGSARLSHIGLSHGKSESLLTSIRLQIDALRALDDGPRARAAALAYLQTWFSLFHPEHPDVAASMHELAQALGGRLQAPRTSPKYAWIEALFGGLAAKRAQVHYNVGKISVLRSWDKLMCTIDKG